MRVKAAVVATIGALAVAAIGVAMLGTTTGAASGERADQTCRGTFAATSRVSIQAAARTAAETAVTRSGGCKGKVMRVARIELVLENPSVKEYRVTLVPTG
jgi:hypothetical protein